jgi:hypothetical protein
LEFLLPFRDISSTCIGDIVSLLDKATKNNDSNLESLLSDSDFNYFISRLDHIFECDIDFDKIEIYCYMEIVWRCCVYSQEYVMKLLREPCLFKAFETFLWEAKEDIASGDFMQESMFLWIIV